MTVAPATEKPLTLMGEAEWSQTVQVRDYEPARATVRLQFLYDLEDPESAIIGIRDAIFKAKTTIFEQFGKTFEISDGVARELVTDGFGGTVVEFPTAVPSPEQPVAVAASPTSPPHDPVRLAKPKSQMSEVEKAMARENQAWAELRLGTHPHEFYDNRADKAAGKVHEKSPDFKHKDTKIGVWV